MPTKPSLAVRSPRRRLATVVAIAAVALLGPLLTLPADEAGAGAGDVTVMTQNLYLGADVAVALDLLPDIPAAAQFLWSQVTATDFTARSVALAKQAAEAAPAVIGLQEATKWVCTVDAATAPKVVYDFTAQYLKAMAAIGHPYVLASAGGTEAFSPGYAIDPIVGLTVVRDPATFQPLFGTDSASCGFRIADALLVRQDLAASVTEVGISTFDDVLDVIPGLISVKRGYAFADLTIGGASVRFVTTHLESTWTAGVVPNSVKQARELVAELGAYTGPLVVMGDFNADPRDPRPAGAPNPGGQPEASAACSGRTCNAYWTMVDAGFTDAGPDATDPANFTWGAGATLAGPDPARVPAAKAMGNEFGYTERLDYVFVRGGVGVRSAELVGERWPTGDQTWECNAPEQVVKAREAAAALGVAVPAPTVCLATDHAALVVVVSVAGAGGSSGGAGWWIAGGVALVLVVLALVVIARRRARSRPTGG